MPNLTGQSIGRYHLLDQLGAGGLSVVYKAQDTMIERLVAVKLFQSERFTPEWFERIRKRLLDDFKALARLDHPNIVRVFNWGEYQAAPYLVMEYVPGGSLKEHVGAYPMPWLEALHLLLPVAQALVYTHHHNIIHGNIKPSDILLTDSGQPKLTDFGIPSLLGEVSDGALIAAGTLTGTPTYMAPELWDGPATPASDQYALGVVLYKLVIGAVPFAGDTPLEILYKHIHSPVASPRSFAPDLPKALESMLLKALAKQPQERYPDMAEFADAMEDLLSGPAMAERPAAAPPSARLYLPPDIFKEKHDHREGKKESARQASRPSLLKRLEMAKTAREREQVLRDVRVLSAPPIRSIRDDTKQALSEALDTMAPPILSSGKPARRQTSPEEMKGILDRLISRIRETASAPVKSASTSAEKRLHPVQRAASEPGTDPVDCTVLAPPQVGKDTAFLVQVFLHTSGQAEAVKVLAQEFDQGSRRLGYQPLEVELARGTRVTIELSIPGMEVEEPRQGLKWQGRTTSVQFGVKASSQANPGPVVGKVTVYLEAVPIGSIRFKLELVSARRRVKTRPLPTGLEARRYQEAFISYCSQDRDEVLKRVQMLERFHIHIFQDILSLEPGVQWEKELFTHIDCCDLFLLFWSSAAKASPWVDREIRHALARKGNDESAPPEIVPIVIEGPPVPEPPPYLAHLQFNDRFIYFMKSNQPVKSD